jgi:NADP-dependent 3-hydroxy acid dehydrogenase YdfG
VISGPSFQEKVAVVTGASSGIGRAIAVALAGCGAEVWLVARRQDALAELSAEIRAAGGRARICSADWTRDADVQMAAETIRRDSGRVDILVLCGGTMAHGRMEQAAVDDLDLQYRSNLRGPYALAQALVPLVRRQQGEIVWINSSAAMRASAGAGQYAAMQHALRALADSLREEVNGEGVRVLSIYPGRTATPRMARYYEQLGKPYRPELLMQPEDVAAMVVSALALPRSAEVTDIHMRPMVKSY